MPKVNLPPGNSALRFEDGTRYRAGRPGGSVVVTDEHARQIDAMRGNGEGGLVHGKFREFGAVQKAGRWCAECRRLWYPWCAECPRCDLATQPE